MTTAELITFLTYMPQDKQVLLDFTGVSLELMEVKDIISVESGGNEVVIISTTGY